MISGKYSSSFLFAQFREFYREVARLKRTVEFAPPVPESERISIASGSSSGSGVSLAYATEAISHAPGPAVTGVWQQLLTLLERQALEAGQGGSFAYEVYREAQYVMAALADEIFLNLEWEGKISWPLLEARLFQSHVAGEEIFVRLDRLLQRRDPFYLDLAAVYFMSLSMGFQGKYRGLEDRECMEYRRQLFRMIYRRDPKLFAATGPLFPQALQHSLDKMQVKLLPAQWVWLWLIVCVFVIWAGASSVAWSSATSKVSCLVCQALQQNCACDAGTGK